MSSESHESHGDVHVYETSGIAEGHAKVPLWLVGVIVLLFGFFAYYVATQWSAQTTSAQPKK